MTFKVFGKLICMAGLVASTALWAADSPSVHDVYLAAQSGNLTQAQSLVEQVIAQHPKSSKAHFVAAEIYAKEGKTGFAKTELQTAEQLEPGLPYANPQAVANLKQVVGLSTGNGVFTPASQRQSSPSFPSGLLLFLIGAIAVIAFIVKAIASRNAPQGISGGYPNANMGTQSYPNHPYPYSPMPQQGGGLGSSIMGGLATGAALGAGMVAGEALMHHFTDGGRAEASPMQPQQDAWGNNQNDMGGQDFGIADTSSWDDSSSIGDVGGDSWS
jgi:uncharacterized protein